MRISYHTVSSNLTTSNGYGYAGAHIERSLRKLGNQVSFRDEQAPIQLNFVQADRYRIRDGQYQIGYTPWESSGIPDTWHRGFSRCDEVWTPSEKCAEWFTEAGVKGPIRVFHHGIEKVWTPKKRVSRKKLKFLHVGDPAPRKGGQLALDAFRAAFGGDTDYHLTLKCQDHTATRLYDGSGPFKSIIGHPSNLANVTIITETLSINELVSLYHSNHVMVYPSYGEGFGFIPLQALATGMPTICTGEWAPYANYLGDLYLEGRDIASPWPEIHPGKMTEPSFDHLVALFRGIADNREKYFDQFYDQAQSVHEEYDWMTLTKNAFAHLETL